MPVPPPDRPAAPATRLAGVLAAAGALLYLWQTWCAFPGSVWNELRLAPAFALAHGETLYPSAGGGPLSTWIYGPVGLLVNLPATLAPSATAAIGLAGALNLLVLVGPLAALALAAPPGRRQLFLALGVLLLPANSLQFQTPDHIAIACGLLSCLCLAPRAPHVVAAGALCALALWAKQTAVFLIPAQAAWLLLRGERELARAYLAAAGVFALLLFGAVLLAFGGTGLWLNLVEIPARLPWGDAADKLARRWPALAAFILLPAAALLGLRLRRLWPAPDTFAGRFLGLALAVSVCAAPVGLLAFFKIGGDLNALHWWFYLAPALAFVWLARPAPSPRLDLALVVLVLAARVPAFLALPVEPQVRALRQAESVARANPGAVWFPCDPLVTFYTDGRLYHVEDGIATRHLAGLGLRQATFRHHLPEHLRAIVYPAEQVDCFALQLLPEFDRRTVVGAWSVFERRPK